MSQRKVLFTQDNVQTVEIKLDKGDVIPAHNHPGTHIFCYMVSGKCRVKSYNMVEKNSDHSLIALVSDTVVTAGQSCDATPDNCNIHSVEALEDAVFLDVFICGVNCEDCCPMDWFELTKASQTEDKFIAKKVAPEVLSVPY